MQKREREERDRREIAANLAYLNSQNAANPLYDAEKEAINKQMIETKRMTPEYQLKEAEREATEKARLRDTEAYWTSDAGKRDKEILNSMDLYAAKTNAINPIINKNLEKFSNESPTFIDYFLLSICIAFIIYIFYNNRRI